MEQNNYYIKTFCKFCMTGVRPTKKAHLIYKKISHLHIKLF